MKKSFILFLALALVLPQVYPVAAAHGYGEGEVRGLFSAYGFVVFPADVDWWGKNNRNQYGTLEQNLQRRFGQNKFQNRQSVG